MKRELTLGSLFDGIGGFPLAGSMVGIKPIWCAEIEPFPCKVTETRFPEMIQLGDVSKVKGSEIPKVDIITFGSPCFTADTKILTSEGLKRISDVRVNDLAFTRNEWKPVTEVMVRNTDEIHKFKAVGVLETHVTGNHPILVRKSKRVGKFGKRIFEEPEWVEVKDIQKGDYVCLPTIQTSNELTNITDEELWLVGRYIADGYINNSQRKDRPQEQRHHKVIFCVGKSKSLEFENHLIQYHGCKKENRTVYKYEISSEKLMKLCLTCGKGAIGKFIPFEILSLPPEKIKIVLDGYMSGDGCHIKSKDIYSATTISEDLALTLQMAVHKAYKIPCRIHKTIRPLKYIIEGREVNQHDTYIVRWSTKLKPQSHMKVIDGEVWSPVTDNEVIAEKTLVYNLEIQDIHSYIANGFVAHNCQDLSVAGKRAGLKNEINGDDDTTRSGLFYDAVRIIKEMRESYNESDTRSDFDIRFAQYPRYAVWENVPGAFSSNKGGTSDAYLKNWLKSKTNTPIFLCLQRENGTTQEKLWETDIPLRGECLMHNFGESPKDVEESFLSQILEEQVPETYSLSAKACQGILARSKKRGKELPEILRIALEHGANK